MFKVDGLIGREFSFETAHCYHLVRDFHRENFGMELTNYACPDGWWDKGGDLFMENYFKEGFTPFLGHPRDVKPGMVSLMAIRSQVANHCGILMPNDQLLHHLVGQPSTIENYNRPIFRNGQVAILMHPKIDYNAADTSTQVDAMELLPPHIRQQIEEGRRAAEPSVSDV